MVYSVAQQVLQALFFTSVAIVVVLVVSVAVIRWAVGRKEQGH